MASKADLGSTTEIGHLRTLNRLLSSLMQAKGPDEVYAAALTSLREGTHADSAAILLMESDRLRLQSSYGLSPQLQTAVSRYSPWKKGDGAESPLVVDIRGQAEFRLWQAEFDREKLRFAVYVPIRLSVGVFGQFVLCYRMPRESSSDELEIAQAIAAQVGMAVQHRRAEAASHQTDRYLRAVLDHAPAVMFLKDRDGKYLLVNKRYEDLFRLNESETIGKTDYDIFSREDAERYRANDRMVLDSGRPFAVEERAPHPDGTIHTYISVKFPLQDADGTVVGTCGISTDITERQQLEIASRYLGAIVESSNDAIISKDLKGIVTSWNRGAEHVFGYSAAEMVGHPISILAAPEQKDQMSAILARLRTGERIENYETQRKRKDGTVIDVSLTISPIRDENGLIVGASKIARDITQRKRDELEKTALLGRERDARRTAELLNQVGPSLASELDVARLVQTVTDIATALVGAEFGAFFHNVVDDKGESYTLYTLSGVPREAFSKFPMPRNTGLFGPTFRGEGPVRCDDVQKDPRYGKNDPYSGMPQGHLPVRSYLAIPVTTRAGDVMGGLFFGHSQPGKFTEAHEAIVVGIAAQASIALDNASLFERAQRVQAELKKSNEELRRTNRDLEVFAYSASHDLREPLRTIAISAQLIEQTAELRDDSAMFIGNILKAARRMSTLIEDLLTYTQATRQQDGPAAPVNANTVLSNVLENLRGQIEESRAIVLAGTLPEVAVHESSLALLFQNLISNAIKYRSQEEPRVDITAEVRDGRCEFSVADNGIGIESEYAGQIFGLFKRLHGRDEYPGSGVGLAICQRVVEQYGGRIWLDQSAVGGGSVFRFSIPASA